MPRASLQRARGARLGQVSLHASPVATGKQFTASNSIALQPLPRPPSQQHVYMIAAGLLGGGFTVKEVRQWQSDARQLQSDVERSRLEAYQRVTDLNSWYQRAPVSALNNPAFSAAFRKAAAKAAEALKVVGEINLALAAVSLGCALDTRWKVERLKEKVPQLKGEAEQLERAIGLLASSCASLIDNNVDAANSASVLCWRDHLRKELDHVQDAYMTLSRRGLEIIKNSGDEKEQAEMLRVVCGVLATVGLLVTLGLLDGGISASLGWAAWGTGTAGAGVAVAHHTVGECEKLISDVESILKAAKKGKVTAEEQYDEAMKLLSAEPGEAE